MTTEVLLAYGSGARMAGIADGSVALVATSPPYFPDAVETQLREGRLGAEVIESLHIAIENFAWTLRPIFDECWRVLMPGGRMIVQTRDVRLGSVLVPVESLHRQMLEATGLRLFTRHPWRPRQPTLARRRIASSMLSTIGPAPVDPEVFLVLHKPGPIRLGEPTSADIQLLRKDILITALGKLPSAHRFQSPIPVLQALIRAHSRSGDLVVDPCSGGGTILLVARQLGRSGWGCDIDQEALRLAQANLGITQPGTQ